MILTIKGADFSAANIGTLNTVSIRKSIGSGVTHSIPSFIEKGVSVTWTLTLLEDYEFGTYSVTMGDTTITPTIADGVMTISIANVTAAISISVATTYVGEDEPDEPVAPPVEPDEPVVPPVDGVINYFNLNDPDVVRDKSLEKDGNLGTLMSNYGVTGYIPCKKGDIIRAGRYLDGAWTANNNVVACFYGENKNYLNGVSNATDYSATSGITSDRIYKPTNDATAYVRLSVKLNYIDYFMVTINEDGVPTEYIPYNYQG